MSADNQHEQDCILEPMLPCAVDTSKNIPDYIELVRHLSVLMTEYSLLCNQLHDDFVQNDLSKSQRRQTISRLKSALIFNELLEHIHLYYLYVPREVVRLREQKRQYRLLLRQMNPVERGQCETNHDCNAVIDKGLSLSQQIRERTAHANLYRNLLNRTNRFLNLSTQVVISGSQLSVLSSFFQQYVGPTLIHVNWIFHIPRLMTNTALIVKHVLPGCWMSAQEQSLPWTIRLSTQINRRWFEMGNDLIWTAVAVLNGFALIGAALPIVPILSTTALFFDVINAALRSYIEIRRLNLLKEQYSVMLKGTEDDNKIQLIQSHLLSIDKRIDFEKKRAALSVGNLTIVLIAACIALPFLMPSPLLLLAASAITIALWFVVLYLSRRLEAQRPCELIKPPPPIIKQLGLNDAGFFAPPKAAPIKSLPDTSSASANTSYV